MVNQKRYPEDSEYGGGEVPQRYPDGTSRPLSEIPGSVSERARLMRTAGINDYSADPLTDQVAAELTGLDYAKMSAAQKEAYDLDMVLKRERTSRREDLRTRTNGYIDEPDQYVGEPADMDPRSTSTGEAIKGSIEGDFSA